MNLPDPLLPPLASSLLVLVACMALIRVIPIGRTLAWLAGITARSAMLMSRTGVSDHWKQRAMLGLSSRMFRTSWLLFAQLVGVLAPVWVLSLLGDPFATVQFLLHPVGWAVASLVAFLGLALSKQLQKRS